MSTTPGEIGNAPARLSDVDGQRPDGLSRLVQACRREATPSDGIRYRSNEIRQVRRAGDQQPIDTSRERLNGGFFE